MGIQQDRLAAGGLLLQQVADLAPPDRIHAVGRLVEQQDVGVVDERRREAQALRHALGELLDADVRPVREPDALEQRRERALQSAARPSPDIRPKIESVCRAVR